MNGKVNFIFCVHNHQPVDNFREIFEKAYQQAYKPFLDIIQRHPKIKVCLHYCGALLEWFEKNKPEAIEIIRKLVDAGQIELLGGGFYEPVFSILPEQDIKGQINMMSEYLQKVFNVKPAGLWLPERIWEQYLVRYFAECGLKYTVVDDFHFKTAGMPDQKLVGYFITEHLDNIFYIFPIKEDLRYSIPFKEPEWTIEYLVHKILHDARSLIVYADDGEKFGLWPRTYKQVWERGWLERFLSLLDKNEFIDTITFSEALKNLPACGKIFLPTCSYREMGEWSLLPQGHKYYYSAKHIFESAGKYQELKQTIPGGYWRNYLAKYQEADIMYKRMLHVSKKVNSVSDAKAQKELYKAQTNCPYWHGIFGGLCLPHLRNGVFSHLIEAENIVEEAKKPGYEIDDLDIDANQEIRIYNKKINIFISPSRGGGVYELDLRDRRLNLFAVLTRRPEYYHRDIKKAVYYKDIDATKSIHDVVLTKLKNIQNYLFYDYYTRCSFIEHFLPPDITLKQIERSNYVDLGDFYNGTFEYRVERVGNSSRAVLSRRGNINYLNRIHKILISKQFSLADTGDGLEVEYEIKNLSKEEMEIAMGIELNLACFGEPDRPAFYHKGDGKKILEFTEAGVLKNLKNVFVNNPSDGLSFSLSFSVEADIFSFPLNIVSLSEEGFELSYQGTCFMPLIKISLESGAKYLFKVEIAFL